MLRRLIDGVLLAVLAWFLLTRLDAGEVVLGLVLAVVIAFTGWRIHRLWHRYKALLVKLQAAEAAKLSDDAAERLRAERILRAHRMTQASDLTLWTGFVLGTAALEPRNVMPSDAYSGGDMAAGGYEGMGGDGGGMAGGDMGGGFGGDM